MKTINGLTLAQHRIELKKWKNKEVVSRFEEVGSTLHKTKQTDHKVAINQLK